MNSLLVVNGDIVFNDNQELRMVSGKEEEAQSIERTLTTRIKEFFLNRDFGFDRATVERKRIDNNEIRMALVDAITFDKRFAGIRNLEIDFNRQERALTVNFKALTADGTTEGTVII